MAKKTNKTSHVLNLITNGGEAEETKEAEEEKEEKNAKDTKNAKKKEETKEKEDAGEKEEAKESAASSRSEVKTTIPAMKERTVVVVEDQNEQISEKIRNELASQLIKEEPKTKPEPEECRIVNVMEDIIKRTNLKKYMEQYGVCMCSRCQADVQALILTRLPAKYVVVQKSAAAPMISFYENKFKIRIFTEILKSCVQVRDIPRHDQK